MANLILFEIIDVSATLAAAWTLLRMIVARPALGWTTPVVVQPLDKGAELSATTEITADIEPSDLADDGITWPKPAWSAFVG
jgi:hypothetical protein